VRILSFRAALPLLASLAFFSLSIGASPTRAEDAPAPKPQPLSPEDAAAKAQSLEDDVMRAFAEKRYEDAEKTCREQVALVPDADNPRYNLACALARLGKTKEALESLKAAIDRGFTDADHMGEDADLASLRGEKAFGELVEAARAGVAKAEEKAYEPGAEIEGIKTVEGSPANGLRWRLRICKDATAEKPHRLVVWLHPSGGSMNKKVEPLSKDLATKGFALLVVTAKVWSGWSEPDAKRLVEGTLPDVSKVEGLDAKRPVLMGFSAGGQIAIMLWAKNPAQWGGLVLDAAYPIDMAKYAHGARGPDSMLSLPEGDAKKGTPFFVLVGDADQGHLAWKFSEDSWRAAGVPLTVTYVPDGKHEWLFGAEQLASLWTWLSDVAAGKLPGAPTPPAEPKPPTK
jgi:pimeloyl-ACP methyl ester carboxylesterase